MLLVMSSFTFYHASFKWNDKMEENELYELVDIIEVTVSDWRQRTQDVG